MLVVHLILIVSSTYPLAGWVSQIEKIKINESEEVNYGISPLYEGYLFLVGLI